MHIQRHTQTTTHVQSAHKRNGDNQAQDLKVTAPVKKSQETRYNLDPGSFFVNRFWGRRPDGVAINEALKIEHILEFKRSP